MELDAAALAVAAVPHVVVTVAMCGQTVLSQVEKSAAAATVSLGGRILERVAGRSDSTPAIQQAVVELAEDPCDADRATMFRAELRRAMQADQQLAIDVLGLLREAGTTVTASGTRAVSIQNNTGIVQTGTGARAFQGAVAPLGRPNEAPDPSPAIMKLPKPPTKSFVGRENELADLDFFVSADRGVVPQSLTMHGLGGVGKSELALQYARRRRDNYALMWWITADNAAAIHRGLAELAYELHPDSQIIASENECARWALGWLQSHQGWLLILDNVEDPADVESVMGRLHNGHLIITTRRDAGWDDITDRCLQVDLLSPSAAVEVLLRLSGQHRTESARALARELGFLPLALHQAGAYLRQTRVDVAVYLEDLRHDPARVLADVAPCQPPERAVARVWAMTMAHLSSQHPGAALVLDVMATLAPGDVPRYLLHGLAANRSTVDQDMGILASYNMVTLTGTTIATHRLVRTVVRDALVRTDSMTTIQKRSRVLLWHAMYDDSVTPPVPRPNFLWLAHHVSAIEGVLPSSFDPDNLGVAETIEAVVQIKRGNTEVIDSINKALECFDSFPDDLKSATREGYVRILEGRESLASAGRLIDEVMRQLGIFEEEPN